MYLENTEYLVFSDTGGKIMKSKKIESCCNTEDNTTCSDSTNKGNSCGCNCNMESIIMIDGRGQIVLPKELRQKADIHSGDKLSLVTCEKKGEICCICIIKADKFAKTASDMLS